jgi:hypothetical protein
LETLASISVPDSVGTITETVNVNAIDEIRRSIGGHHPASGPRLVAGARP